MVHHGWEFTRSAARAPGLGERPASQFLYCATSKQVALPRSMADHMQFEGGWGHCHVCCVLKPHKGALTAGPDLGIGCAQDVMQHDDANEEAAGQERSRGRQHSGGDGALADSAAGPSEDFVDAPESKDDDEDDDDDDDFEKYLNELSGSDDAELVEGHAGKEEAASASKEEYESGEDLDLDDYMRVLADEGK